MKETFGQRLSKFRKEKNLTQEEISEKVNVSPQAVSKWENDLSIPDIETILKLSEILDVSLDLLLGKETNSEKAQILPKEDRKDSNKLILKIKVLSKSDKVIINLPVALIKVCLETGMSMPQINGNETLSKIDFNKILELVEQGVIGELLSIESEDGDKVSIIVE